jgi:hypothetical protein
MYPDAFALGLMVGRAKLRYRSIKVIPGGGRPETSGDGSEGREDVMELPFAHLRGEVSKPNHNLLFFLSPHPYPYPLPPTLTPFLLIRQESLFQTLRNEHLKGPWPQTQNPQPQTPIPKPQSTNPEAQIPNPKP